jgi:hypothetical protein
VWFSAFAITLSVVACFASLWFALRALHASPRGAVGWGIAAVAALIISGLCYEVAMPLFFVHIATLVYLSRRRGLWLAIGLLAGLFAVVVVKVVTTKTMTVGQIGGRGLLGDLGDILYNVVRRSMTDADYGLNIWRAMQLHYGTYGLWLPRTLIRGVAGAGPTAVVVAALTAAATAAYLLRTRIADTITMKGSVVAAGAGFALLWVGYAIFLTNYNLKLTTAGIGNRASIVASAGAALSIVGLIGAAAAATPLRVRRMIFASCVAVLVGGYMAVDFAIASYWIRARAESDRTLQLIVPAVAKLPRGSTVLLKGACPYVGPAIVFEAHWDLTGALQIATGDSQLQADVVVLDPGRVVDDGIHTVIYGSNRRLYPFGSRLYAIDRASGDIGQLKSPDAARAFFAPPAAACPRGYEGIGVPVL